MRSKVFGGIIGHTRGRVVVGEGTGVVTGPREKVGMETGQLWRMGWYREIKECWNVFPVSMIQGGHREEDEHGCKELSEEGRVSVCIRNGAKRSKVNFVSW